MLKNYITLLLIAFGSKLPLTTGFKNIKDHSAYDYYVLEISKDHIDSFINEHISHNIQFENSLYGFEYTHQVISIPKNTLHKKRDLIFDNEKIDKIHELKPTKKLFKRTPQPVETTIISSRDENDGIWDGFSEEQQKQLENIMEEYQINDPLFKKQWHLVNSFYPGNDLNILPVWDMNITGEGVTVAIVDDGLDYENEDLKNNFNAKGSYDFNDKTPLPQPRLADDYHGTRCAGEIAAAKDNDYCGLGVAYNAKVSGLRILSGEVTAEEEAAAMIYEMNENDIYSCSWGPVDNGKEMEKPSELVSQAMEKGVKEGRDSKGNIYVFASGNGANLGDNCNYDGYTNSINSITVGAIDWKGLHSPYSESCSALLTVTYSSGSNEYIHSTDINNVCADRHGGTSAAAPMAAGVYALVLEANKDLTWRDVQYLTIETSVVINEEYAESEWQQPSNYFNKKYSHMYGFGKIDAFEIVSRSIDWVNVNEQVSHLFDKIEVNEKSTSENEYIESKINITEEQLANFKHLEHLTVIIDADANMRGLTEIDLIAPDGSVSHLGIQRKLDKKKTGFPNWKFMSVVHWGTNGVGEWTLRSRVTRSENELNLKNWQLEIFGEKRDEEKEQDPSATTSEVATSSITSTSSEINELLPTSTTTTITEETPSTTSTTTTTDTITPTATPSGDHHETLEKGEKLLKAHHYLGLLVFILILITFYYLLFINKKKKFQRLRAEAYEFDIIDNDSEYNTSLNNTSLQNAEELGSNQSVIGNDGDEARFNFDISDVDVEEAFDFNSDAELLGDIDNIQEETVNNETNVQNDNSEVTEESFKNPFSNTNEH
ncbi:hypothetical protein HANVADRAFT_53429 [Hanseniaspora valbyensis NRRL Y-1626]|uniref:P/Homo B domain-containing protein n=1 Tax=Hanseniaspora valbyensis NRRL Y-1626 TaxID=766949 RepID=A0A1B7TBE1_9ASCO|nr:hypothetical protein HANVADRAFT_53429 [Hanseniaspora valbyensis NRRL Y-1626]